MQYQRTTATNKILELKKRIRGVAGGTSASKTVSIMMWLIDYAQTTDGELISVVSESLPHLKRGAIRDFLAIMEAHNYFDDARWNKSDYIYTFDRGSKIEFFSADQPYKVRGPRRDVLFINEANNVSYETFTQLEIRTNKIIWLDWNPVSEFWFYTDEQGKPNVIGRPDVDFITLTYRDNEALSQSIVNTIEMRRGNAGWWKVYGEGQLGEAEGRIYKDWLIIDEVPHEARLERYGLDFGYTNDPTACVAIYYYNGGYIWDEILYQRGLSNKQIADTLNNIPKALTIADSAEPKSIEELRTYGINVLPSVKGEGSILQGIQWVQSQRISVTKSSVNLLKEYRNYLWQQDKKDGVIKGNIPGVIWNHLLDAGRYAMSSLRVDDYNELPPDDTLLFRDGFY